MNELKKKLGPCPIHGEACLLSDYDMIQSLKKIQEFCEDRDICLLGNADSILRKKRPVDEFDIVARCNRGTPMGKEDYIGNRTDILFLSTNISGESIRDSFNPKFVTWMTICHRLASPWTLDNAIQNPRKDWNILYEKLGLKPTTGMLAIYFLLKHIEFKSLAIYGFDFFKTKTWYNPVPYPGMDHNGKKEEVLILKMIKNKENVSLII